MYYQVIISGHISHYNFSMYFSFLRQCVQQSKQVTAENELLEHLLLTVEDRLSKEIMI